MPKAGMPSVQTNPGDGGQSALSAPWILYSNTAHNVINCAAFFGDPNYDDVEIKCKRKLAQAPTNLEAVSLAISAIRAIFAAGARAFTRVKLSAVGKKPAISGRRRVAQLSSVRRV